MPPRHRSWIRSHSLSLVIGGLLALWLLLYLRADPSTHLGAFYGNSIADWLGSFVAVVATKFWYEKGSIESRLPPRWRGRGPYWLREHSLTIVLLMLVAGASMGDGIRILAPGLVSAVGVAAAIDALMLRRQQRAWEFPSGAVLTGLLIAMILRPQEPWYVPAATSALAIVSKYIFRTRSANSRTRCAAASTWSILSRTMASTA